MSTTSRLAGALLFSTALITPSLAFAQTDTSPTVTPPTGEGVADPNPAEPSQEDVDISIPGGGDIVVTGARDRNIAKSSDQVVSILSTAEIARTGEGNIAGALGRVTGLSVVGSGYVYVRGLGDRYSLALLNGLPLPSPEPLRRVVPLDIFPSSIIASSLVQKSYSANFPGEYGGGVINLTTKAIPEEGFFTIGFGVSGDSETTGQVGYTHYGTKSDTTGFGNGGRRTPPALKAFFASGARLSEGYDSKPIASELVTGRTGVAQRWGNLPPNVSASLSGGKSFDLGWGELGVIATAGYSNKFQNRMATQQSSLSSDLSFLESDFTQLNTDQRIVVNGLVGVGLEFGDNKIRWTNLYIRDTIKQTRLSLGRRQENPADVMQQRTGWYARQLIDTQLVGEFRLTPELRLEVRGTYANSQRQAPFETQFEYVRTNSPVDPYGAYYINTLNRARGDARVTFSELDEDLWAGGIDLGYTVVPDVTVTVGGTFADTTRTSSRREFFFDAGSGFIQAVGLLRPDRLLSPQVINAADIRLQEADEGNPAFKANLRNWAGYGKVNAQVMDALSLDIGVRFEKATQSVDPILVFNNAGASTEGTELKRDYWLPTATLTYEIQQGMQVRLHGSKTIARPQFRELINQPYFDPDSNRTYRGNPLLTDSQLYNGEARFEWYFAPEQRVSIAGFYKKIKNPIEAYITGGDIVTSFANAPEAQLYGAEVEAQKYIDISGLGGEGSWFSGRRAVIVGNYTFTKSKLKVGEGDLTGILGVTNALASDYFRDGAAMTGQSDHIANLQLGLENTDRLSQQTLLLTYASDRVVSRGLNGSVPQPDVIERPGLRIDFVAREGFTVGDRELEIKFEARNITARKHIEFQQSGANRLDINTYALGRSFALSGSMKF